MNQENPISLNSLLTNRDPEEVDCYHAGTFNKSSLEEVIRGLLCLRLPEEVAARRAPMVVEDMATIGFRLRPEVHGGFAQWLHQQGLRIPIEYDIPGTGWTVNHRDPSLLDGISRKFPQRSLAELNIAAVTLFSQIDDTVTETAERWLEDEPNLDAVILWSEQSSTSPPLAFRCSGGRRRFLAAGLRRRKTRTCDPSAYCQALWQQA